MKTEILSTIDEIQCVRHHPSTLVGIATDSRNIKPGFLFVAITGFQDDGRKYIPEAIQNGASAVLLNEKSDLSEIPETVSIYTSFNVRRALSSIAARFYPKQPETIAAVTGTSGKTSTAQFAMELWTSTGQIAGSLGTLGIVTPAYKKYGSLTTPDPITLHQILDNVASKGVTHLAMEASSHGIELNRLSNVKIKVGAFTNLSRDHLDYHKTMEAYFAAKQRLFTDFVAENGTAVLNADIPEYETLVNLCKKRKLSVISYGKNGNEIKLIDYRPQSTGQLITFDLMGRKHEVFLPVIGSFQVWNSLCALGIVIGSGSDAAKAVAGLEKLSGVPGRLQYIGETPKGGIVFVDYAHKPDALENVLNGLRPHVTAHAGSKLGVVFGCGGNRDPGKRPLMGEIAQRLADWVIVTDDNPRNEDPAAIRQAILAGCVQNKNLREIEDRALAIQTGIEQLNKNDVLVIAGKGHETGQIVGDQTLPFDDGAIAKKTMGIEE